MKVNESQLMPTRMPLEKSTGDSKSAIPEFQDSTSGKEQQCRYPLHNYLIFVNYAKAGSEIIGLAEVIHKLPLVDY